VHYNLKTAGHLQFYVAMHLTWSYKSTKLDTCTHLSRFFELRCYTFSCHPLFLTTRLARSIMFIKNSAGGACLRIKCSTKRLLFDIGCTEVWRLWYDSRTKDTRRETRDNSWNQLQLDNSPAHDWYQ